MKVYKSQENYRADRNSIIDVIPLIKYESNPEYNLSNAFINIGGWQSWNPCFEVMPEKKQPSLTCHFIKGWNNYLVFPETEFKPSKNIVLGQFITYLRWNNHYLFFVSIGNKETDLPPVQFVFDRNKNTVSIELCDKNQYWQKNDLMAEIEIFSVDSYFAAKEKLVEIFGNQHFESVTGLGNSPAGWESWYNHYAKINEQLISKDLDSLDETDNLLKNGDYTSKIFQIDDGWENNLGDWDFNKTNFPSSPAVITQKIENKNYIPGLWIAPFIIDSRSDTATMHKSWLLKDSKGKNVVAGYNPLWGKNGNFYCLDLGNSEVLEYLDSLFDKIINEWQFRYIKLDFLYAGMIYGKSVSNFPQYKLYKNALTIITSRKTNCKGFPVYYLGCGVPFELSFTKLPLSRIGCDTYEHWENKISKLINWNGRNSAYLNLKDTLGHSLWNKTVFLNDPDVIFIRKENCYLSYEEKKLISCVALMFGSQLMISDDFEKYNSEEEHNLTKEIIEFKNEIKDEEFGLKQSSNEKYEFFSKSNKYNGIIDLSDNPHIKFYNKKGN